MMFSSRVPFSHRPPLTLRSATWIILLLWLVYTILYTLHPSDAPAVFLEFVPGVLAVAALLAAGISRQECYLRIAPISRTGLKLLAVSFLFVPIILLTGHWRGWNGPSVLVYALASGISQELFFRAALLPLLLAKFKSKPFLAISIHSLFFALWHAPKAYMTAPLGGLIGVVAVTFINGLLWARQVERDRTVVWLMGYHSILLFINSFFTWE
ncbi:CPBP family intramembrane metalloprotease [Chloroflexi bacterium CFX2]|nr:CPBP family intramembrane metalloprotease [Chloroflexi bacterium CFX2]